MNECLRRHPRKQSQAKGPPPAEGVWACSESLTLALFAPLVRDTGDSDGGATHDSQITQEATPKSLGTSEASYASVNRGPPLDRAEVYTSKLQD